MTRYLLLFDSYGLDLGGALSDERTGLSSVYAAGPCPRSLSRSRIPWDSRPYITVSDFRLPLSSPPTTRRVTVEIFDPASRRGSHSLAGCSSCTASVRTQQKISFPTFLLLLRHVSLLRKSVYRLSSRNSRPFHLHYSDFSPHVTIFW
jgi:hypothetical protein